MDEQVEAAPGVNVPAVKIYRWGAVMTWLPFGFFGALYIAGQLGFKPSWTAILYTAGLSPCIAIMGFFIQLVGFVAGRPWRVQKYPFLFFFSIVSLPVWVAILLNY